MKQEKDDTGSIPQEAYDLYDDYAHNRIGRREFVQHLSVYAVGGLTVASMLKKLLPDYSKSAQISPQDPRIQSGYVEYPSPKGGGKIKGLLCVPSNLTVPVGGVLVVHENRGLNPYIEDVARRVAAAGYIALAPDALSPLGGYPGNDDEGRAMQAKRDRMEMLEDFKAGHTYLIQRSECHGKAGVVGFCFGGWIANMMAVQVPDLACSVPYYGGQPPLDQVQQIGCPLQLHYAGLDTRVNEGWPAYEEALKKHEKKYTAFFYENVNHGFHNDSTSRFDPAAAALAWERTLAFFAENIK
jgi:carboxymethylenebutenolidase